MKLAFFFLPAIVAGVSLPAQGTPEGTASGSWVFTPTFASQYMFRGARLGGPSLQPSLEYDRGGLTAGLWGNVPLLDKVAGQSDPEVDLFASYAFALGPNLSLAPGVTAYTYPAARQADGFYQATVEPSLALNCTLGAVRFTPKLYYDLVLRGLTAELTAAWAVPLPAAGTELDFTATAGTFKWNDYTARAVPAVRNWGDYWLLGVSAPYQLPGGSRIIVGWAYAAGSDNYLKQGSAGKVANPAALGRGVLTLGYTLTF